MPYVLDTNIVSEFMKPRPSFEAISWTHDHQDDLYLTSVTVMELYYGAMRLPEGKRKRELRGRLDAIVKNCKGHIYLLDDFSAYLCAKLRCDAEASGRTPQIADVMIAAICQRNDAILVTHNTKDFDYFNIPLVDPFDYESETLKRLKREEPERDARG